jgi:hypothetical protein
VVSEQLSVVSEQLSVVSEQLSVVSEQLSVVSEQLSVVSCQLSVKDGGAWRQEQVTEVGWLPFSHGFVFHSQLTTDN